MEDKLYWLALNMVPGIGPVLYRKLVARFENPQRVFTATTQELTSLDGIGEKIVKAIHDFPAEEIAAEELKRARGLGVSIITFRDQGYPRNLLQIYDPPPILYVRGELGDRDAIMIAIVGSRRGSPYGRAVTKRISKELSTAGVTVVSGMARGIDTFAHLGALEAGGRTIAVFGCGVDIIYPPENKKLFFDIIDHGAIISEFPLSTPPEGKNFPRRNRIISGLSLGVLVVEATVDSGSLITASHALDQDREVFAVPGNVGSATSRGTNRLIKQGAKLVEGAQDILTEIAPQHDARVRYEELPPLNDEEQGIFKLLSYEPLHIDEISRLSSMEVYRVSTILLELEIKGAISQLGGMKFVRN